MDQAAINALKTRCSNSPYAKNIYYLVGDSNEVVVDIVSQIEQIDKRYIQDKWPSLNVAFLDPEGLELEWSTVAALAKVNRMDLVI
ncbi:MAG TPA: hypothetical protein VMS95_06070 [Candidatus Krumholzibacteriaceae bacterium]|nr:hypothetical protein [Candidatus Krumholzibacteriaceae bacterium]